MNHEQSILIEGIGGIGGVVAGMMIDAGFRPALVTGNPAITDTIRRDGIRAKTPEKSCHVQAEVFTHLSEAASKGPYDAAYLIMKAQGVADTARATLPLLKEKGYIVTFQNGIVEDDVMEAVGANRVIGACVAWGGTMHAAGVYERTTPGSTIIGELDGSDSERIHALADALTPSAPAAISHNIRGVLWTKLAINCTINSVGALTGQTLGEMIQNKRIRTIFLRTYSEAVDVALALGIQLERVNTDPKRLYLPKDAGWFTRMQKDFIMRLVGKKYSKTRSSTLQSLERGRPTEVDFLNGYVVALGKKAGVLTPVNGALTRMIKEIEAGKRAISRDNTAALAQELGIS